MVLNFTEHRWVAGHREEAYSDWLQWIMAQADAVEVLRVFGVNDPGIVLACTGTAVMVVRERCVLHGTKDPLEGLISKSGWAIRPY